LNLRLAWRIGLAFVVVGILAIVALNLAPERRDLREPIPHHQAVSDPQFLRTMDGIFGGNLRGGHEIETLLNGVEIFPAMLESIRRATTLNFETFVYWSGEIAEEFANEMAEPPGAASRCGCCSTGPAPSPSSSASSTSWKKAASWCTVFARSAGTRSTGSTTAPTARS
jgi:hypothetical protein